MTAFYNVSYKDTEGNEYMAVNIEAVSSYEAESIVAGRVNGNQNFGISFKAEFVSF